MRSLEAAAIAICLVATLPSIAQGICEPGCTCGIPGCTCGETGHCSASASPETSSTIFLSPPDTSAPVITETYSTIDLYTSGPEISAPEYPYPANQPCPAKPPSTHLVPDLQHYPECAYKCEDGYEFDEHGECVKVPSYTSPSLNPAEGTTSQLGLETSDGNKIGVGDIITLSPADDVVLGTKCKQFYALLKANMGTTDVTYSSAGLMKIVNALADKLYPGYDTGTLKEAYPSLKDADIKGHEEMMKRRLAFVAASFKLGLFIAKCNDLEIDPNKLEIQSTSSKPILLGSLRKAPSKISGPSVQIGLHLESGPFLSEVVNNGVSLDVDTATAAISSIGNNTFGVVYDPTNSTSYIVAYQQPVVVQPKNNSFSPFTLSGSHAVIVDAKSVSSIVSLASISDNATLPAGASSGTSSSQSSIEPTGNLQKLEQLKKMLDAGLITQEDYNLTKNRILSEI